MTAKRTKQSNKFPNTIFVVREPDGDSSYLVAHESVEDAAGDVGDTVAVGRYEFVGTSQVRTTVAIS